MDPAIKDHANLGGPELLRIFMTPSSLKSSRWLARRRLESMDLIALRAFAIAESGRRRPDPVGGTADLMVFVLWLFSGKDLAFVLLSDEEGREQRVR